MRKLRRYIQKHPRFTYGLYVAGVLIVAAAAMALVRTNAGLPGTVWLPDRTKYKTESEALFSLPVKAENVTTSYGKAVRYTTTTNWSQRYYIGSDSVLSIYEFKPAAQLHASTCPNITNIEALSPSDCAKAGSFQNSTVYKISRRLPSTMVEYFVQAKGTFIYMRGGDITDLQTFQAFSRYRTHGYLAANNKRAEQVKAVQKQRKAAEDYANSQTYTYLNFTPALATVAPSGWTLSGSQPEHIGIDGPDNKHPKLISTGYSAQNGEQGISWYSGKLSDFVVMGTCGPTPGQDMAKLPCYRVPGTDFYEADFYDQRNDFLRYTYYPVGSTLVITSLVVFPSHNERPAWPTDLVNAQNILTKSAQPVSKDKLKGSRFEPVFYSDTRLPDEPAYY